MGIINIFRKKDKIKQSETDQSSANSSEKKAEVKTTHTLPDYLRIPKSYQDETPVNSSIQPEIDDKSEPETEIQNDQIIEKYNIASQITDISADNDSIMADFYSDKYTKAETSDPHPGSVFILESRSMVCDIEAYVDKNNSCYYFYLCSNPLSLQAKIKCCWICNRKPAPEKVNFDELRNGASPMMPAEYVAHDPSGIELDEKSLNIVWFEDGDSAALLSGNDVLCIIPGWSGMRSFHGYSKYAKGTGPFAWEIAGALEKLSVRIEYSKRLWNYFGAKEHSDAWMLTQQARTIPFVGTHENDFPISRGKFPPKVITTGERNGVVYGVTAGVSMISMPTVDFRVDGDPKDYKRMELGFATLEKYRHICQPMYKNLTLYSDLPWKQITFISHGNTIPIDNIDGYAAVMFINAKNIDGLESPEYRDFPDGSVVNMLWAVPITLEEYNFTLEKSAEDLFKYAYDLTNIHIFDGQKKFMI